MNRSIRAKVVVGLISPIGMLALVAFLVYWSRGAEAQASRSTPLLMIAAFAGMALVLSGISAWLLARELRNSATRSISIAANEAQYHELCDNAFDLIDMLTPNGKFIYTNRAWREALGYTAEEASHLWLKDVVHPEDFPYSQKSICGLLAGEPGRNRFEVRFRKKNGEIINLEGTVNCRRENGRPTVIQGILRDVTARKRAEQELRELQRRLQAALQKEKELARVDPLTLLSNRGAFLRTGGSRNRAGLALLPSFMHRLFGHR